MPTSPSLSPSTKTSHLISQRAARDANFRDILAMVMEGRAPKDYVEGFWTEVENMRLDEVERRVEALAERNEMLRSKEEVRRKMRRSGARVHGSLGEWFEDYKEGKTTDVGYLGVAGEVEDEHGDDQYEKWSVGDAEVEGEAAYGAAGDDGDAVGLARHLRSRNGLRDSSSSGSDGDLEDGDDKDQEDRSDDTPTDGEELHDSSEDEEAIDEDGDTTMLDDDDSDAIPLTRTLSYGRRQMKDS